MDCGRPRTTFCLIEPFFNHLDYLHLYYFHDSSAAFLQQVKDILGVKLVNVIVVYAILCLIHADLIKNVLQ